MDPTQLQSTNQPQEMPSAPVMPSQPLPEWNTPPKTGSSSNDGKKKQLLEKLMTNLLNKPGRSMHEMINGVKDVIGAYKNYAKEWDTLNGVVADSTTPTSSSGGMSKAGSGDIQKILQGIQQQKAQNQPEPTPQPPQNGMGGPGTVGQMPNLPPMDNPYGRTPPYFNNLGF